MNQILKNLDLPTLRTGSGIRPQDPVGEAGDVGHLSRALEEWITDAALMFSCQGIDLSAEEVAAPDGLLPLVLFQAQECMARATGSSPSVAVVHQESDTGLCGVAISQLRSMSIGQWLLFSSFALEERSRNHGIEGPVPVDEWYESWQKALVEDRVMVLPATTAPQPVPTSRS